MTFTSIGQIHRRSTDHLEELHHKSHVCLRFENSLLEMFDNSFGPLYSFINKST